MALETELRHFDTIKEELLRHHDGKHALIISSELIGVFDHRAEAYKAGLERRGNVPMLIKRIAREETLESVPSMSLGLLSARI